MDEFIMELLKNLDGKRVLGSKGKLSKILEIIAQKMELTQDDAMKIQSQLIDEYEIGKVKDEGLITRMIFLCNNKFDFKSIHKISMFINDEDSCPYCGMELNDSTTSCHICGYNLEYTDDEEEVITMDEANKYLSDILVNIGRMDRKTADILLNQDDNPLYYLDDNKIINFNDSSDEFEFDDESIDEMDDDFCYRLNPSHRCKWDTYELCFYNSLRDLYYFPENIEDIIMENAEDYECDDNQKVFDELVDKGYISKYIIPEYWENTVKDLKKKDLQDILRKNNLKVSGNKKDLTKRIKENVNLEEMEFNSIEAFNSIGYTIYLVTPKGEEYLNTHEHVDLFNYPLDEYHYGEYKNFIKNKDNLLQASIDFLDLHIKQALKLKNQFDYTTHLRKQTYLYSHFNDDDNYFKSLIRLFVAYLNPINTDDIFFYCDELIDEYTLKKIRKSYNSDYDVESIIVNEYSNIEHITIPLNELIENIPALLSKDNHKQLDKKWRKAYIKHNIADWD